MNEINSTKEKKRDVPCMILDQDDQQCGEPGWPNGMTGLRIATCERHYCEAFSAKERMAENTIHALNEAGVIQGHTPGWTYAVLMRDNTIKIGMSEDLERRLRDVSRKYNNGDPVELLSLLEGGRSTELLVHGKWRHLRINDRPGERFTKAPELMAWIESKGIHASGQIFADKYNKWREKKMGTPVFVWQ